MWLNSANLRLSFFAPVANISHIRRESAWQILDNRVYCVCRLGKGNDSLTYEEKYYRMCLRTSAAAWVIEWARKEMERAKEHEALNKDIDYYAWVSPRGVLGCSGCPHSGVCCCIYFIKRLIFCLTNPVKYGTIRHNRLTKKEIEQCIQ